MVSSSSLAASAAAHRPLMAIMWRVVVTILLIFNKSCQTREWNEDEVGKINEYLYRQYVLYVWNSMCAMPRRPSLRFPGGDRDIYFRRVTVASVHVLHSTIVNLMAQVLAFREVEVDYGLMLFDVID
jgi:hypothetical protein